MRKNEQNVCMCVCTAERGIQHLFVYIYIIDKQKLGKSINEYLKI